MLCVCVGGGSATWIILQVHICPNSTSGLVLQLITLGTSVPPGCICTETPFTLQSPNAPCYTLAYARILGSALLLGKGLSVDCGLVFLCSHSLGLFLEC